MPGNSGGSNGRILTATLLSTLLVSALASSLFVSLAKANAYTTFYSPPSAPSIILTSPEKLTQSSYYYHPTFTIDSLEVAFTITMSWGYYSLSPVQCRLDGSLLQEFPAFDFSPHVNPPPEPTDNSVSFSVVLPHLSEGLHSLEIRVAHVSWESGDWAVKNLAPYEYLPSGLPDLSMDYYSVTSDLIKFWVETAPPVISVLPAAAKTLVVPDVSLNFTVNEPVSWLAYSLDGGGVVEVTGTAFRARIFNLDNYCVVLRGLSAGVHSLTVYAEDLVGNRGASASFSFTVNQEAPSETDQEHETEQTESFPTVWVIAVAIIASAALVSFGLVAYFLWRKKSRAA
jgi:hypothetical protein